MKTIFDNLQENLSVAIELLSHTLKITKEKSEMAKDSPIMQDIFARLSPDKLETVKEKEPEKPTDILADIVDKYCSQYVKVRGDKVSEITIYQQKDRASACFNIKTSTGEFYHFYI